MSSKEKVEVKEIPQNIVDPSSKKKYQRGKFLGKGGFAKCYELTDLATQKIFAGKIVSKSMLMKQHQKEKMSQEISIHRNVKHKNIVGFHSFFEDKDNVYVILELCRRRSMMELHKRRKAITEPEVRYFLQQLLQGVKYLHDQKIIHRDLKLGNLFLDDEMQIKVGDFGLATRVDYDGERKRTLCGTPNYIAPEVLSKKGHSYEVDVWSIGCILYTLLVGKPPFETQSLKDTYLRIKKNEYTVPSSIAPLARSLITKLLQADPVKRPNVDQILKDDFMTLGYIPSRLPTSCLTMAPRFDTKLNASVIAVRRPLLEINTGGSNGVTGTLKKEGVAASGTSGTNKLATLQENAELAQQFAPAKNDAPTDCYLQDLYGMLTSVIAAKPAEKPHPMEDEAEDPAAVPMIWVSKWVDYSDKYGLGYQLCDDSIGVLYNDSTKLLLLANGDDTHYIEREGKENYHTLSNFPSTLHKKVTLLKYFRNYMNEHLVKAGASMKPRDGDELSRIPSLRTWFRTRSAIVLHLTNGTLQINFFQDHSKIILCSLMGAVTYIDEKRTFRTFRLSLIEKFGCNPELASRLRYSRTMVERLISTKSGSAHVKTTN